MNITDVPNSVWQEAWDIVLSKKNDYPEDDWCDIQGKWDLNLWTEDDTGFRRASLYKEKSILLPFMVVNLDDFISLAVEEEFAVIDSFDEIPDFIEDDEVDCPFCQSQQISDGGMCLICREHI